MWLFLTIATLYLVELDIMGLRLCGIVWRNSNPRAGIVQDDFEMT